MRTDQLFTLLVYLLKYFVMMILDVHIVYTVLFVFDELMLELEFFFYVKTFI